METELINCSSYLDDNLKYYVKFEIEVQVTKGQIYKEDLHRNLYNVISRLKDNIQDRYILQIFKNVRYEGESLIFHIEYKDSNEGYVESIVVKDNFFRIEYAEFRRESLTLPNLINIVLPYICLLEASKCGQKEGASFKIAIKNTIDTTMRAVFTPNTSLFAVNLVNTIPYSLSDKSPLNSSFENEDLVYNAIRRFYQQFKSEANCQIPYLELTKEVFATTYAALWK